MKDLLIKKLYYSISEVSKITEVEQYVLRYWETEFDNLKPQKNRAGNRIYTNKDIQLILYIKNLLREKKYTIEGAKKILENYVPEAQVKTTTEKEHSIHSAVTSELKQMKVESKEEEKPDIKKDLKEIKEILQFLLKKLQ
ncbi:MAG TPA: MerR family transcriptional regulator [Ignavibacteriaceae bacterium]|nr:MerR family transcriptional regulator [Ignavibacteriaceae bacterium]